jgi:hypothetical protein
MIALSDAVIDKVTLFSRERDGCRLETAATTPKL